MPVHDTIIEDGKSPRTIDSYFNDVKQFRLYLMQKAADEQRTLSRFLYVHCKQHSRSSKLVLLQEIRVPVHGLFSIRDITIA